VRTLITSIHVCSNGNVYVEKEGAWYVVCENPHAFAEIKNWSAEYWERHRQDPPCKPAKMPTPPGEKRVWR
jgi:hypothetical protein